MFYKWILVIYDTVNITFPEDSCIKNLFSFGELEWQWAVLALFVSCRK